MQEQNQSFKSGLTADGCHGLLSSKCFYNGWALCIGAGTSRHVFPLWDQLVVKLLQDQFGPVIELDDLAKSLVSQFGADAAIQTVRNKLQVSDDEFACLISNALYSDLIASASPDEWDAISYILCRPGKKSVQNGQWKSFLSFFRSMAKQPSCISIAKILLRCLNADRMPVAILSFNAEVLSFQLFNALVWEQSTDSGAHPPREGDNREFMDLVTRGISTTSRSNIPYYLCHGVLPVPGKKPIVNLVSTDKLVFSEAEYLMLSNSSFSWQSSAFLGVSVPRHVVFIGLSLSDSNIRRWLAWSHASRLSELSAIGQDASSSTHHYWLRTVPQRQMDKEWIEASVCHLGIRLVWMNSWDELPIVLGRMLGLES
jgi:hypothetical protein